MPQKFMSQMVIAGFVLMVLAACNSGKKEASELEEPEFLIEGEVEFKQDSSRKSLVKIGVEIAYKAQETIQGLMYRNSMPEKVGMLFIFEM